MFAAIGGRLDSFAMAFVVDSGADMEFVVKHAISLLRDRFFSLLGNLTLLILR